MNNCPKCGNPLQVGITSCPICGTDVSNNQNNNVNQVKQNVQVASVAATNTPQKVVEGPSMPSVTPTVTPAVLKDQMPNNNVAKEPVSLNKVVSNVAVPNGEAANPINNQVAPNVSAPISPTVQNNQALNQANINESNSNATPNQQIATIGQPVNQASVVPTSLNPNQENVGIPSSLSGAKPAVPEIQNLEAPKNIDNPNSKKGLNRKTALLVGIILIVLIVSALLFMLMNNNSNSLNKPVPPADDEKVENTRVLSNGFKFNLQDGWLLSEYGNNVYVTNSTDTVALRLSGSPVSFSEITEEEIQKQINANSKFSSPEIGTTQISARDAYIVNSSLNNLPVQIYFINGGTALTLGVVTIYKTEESKTKFESNVLEMIGSISYSDDSMKAISTIDMYSDAFNLFNDIINKKEINNNDVTNQENNGENNEVSNNGENNSGENNDQNNQNPVVNPTE